MPSRDLNKMLTKNNYSEPEIVRGKGYQLSTDVETQTAEQLPAALKEKAPPVERQSVRIRKDLLLRCEQQKLNRKKSGNPMTLGEIIEMAVEEWLDKEEKQ